MEKSNYQPTYLNGARFTEGAILRKICEDSEAQKLLINRINLVASNTLIPTGIALMSYGSYKLFSAGVIHPIVAPVVYFCLGPVVITAVIAASIVGAMVMHGSWNYKNYLSENQIKYYDNWVKNIDPEKPETLKGADIRKLFRKSIVDRTLRNLILNIQEQDRESAAYTQSLKRFIAYREGCSTG